MKKLQIPVLLIIIPFLLGSSSLFAQEVYSPTFGFDSTEWESINARWEKLRPGIIVVLNNKDTISGQLIYSQETQIVLYTGQGSIFNNLNEEELQEIPLKNIDHIIYDKGGPKYTGLISGALSMGAAGTVGGLVLAGGWSYIPGVILGGIGTGGGAWAGNKMQKASRKKTILPGEFYSLKSKALLAEKIRLPGALDLLVTKSPLVRKVFPDKHLRISFGLNAGPNTIKKELISIFESSSLPEMTEYRSGSFAFDFFDLSWRLNDKFILGAQIHLNMDSYTYLFYSEYFYNNPPANDIYYSYDIQLYESRIYCEYAIKPVNRYFSKKHELLVGGGIIFSNPIVDFSYSYVPNEFSGNNEYIKKYTDKTVIGAQARAAFHYYPFPGFSLFGGAEINVYQNLAIESYTLPTSDPGIYHTIPEHKLNFSALRLKVGASMYF